MAAESTRSGGCEPRHNGTSLMHHEVYHLFQTICRGLQLTGPVLEVGAVAGNDGLLQMECLAGVEERVGLNKEPQDSPLILTGDANDMKCFRDGRFQAVLCNATLEHDRFFWKTLEEIHRVTAVGGYIVMGVPGYGEMGTPAYWPRLASLAHRFLRILPSDVLHAGTPTLGIHNFPGDYYRFSEQAVREVFLAGLTDIRIFRALNPPRFVGIGRKE